MRQHFIIGGQYFPAADRTLAITHAQAHTPYSYAFCCPKCGEVWARAGVEGNSQWSFLQRACSKHSEGLQVPGSVWLSWDRDFTNAFPLELLLRELHLHINYFEGASSCAGSS